MCELKFHICFRAEKKHTQPDFALHITLKKTKKNTKKAIKKIILMPNSTIKNIGYSKTFVIRSPKITLYSLPQHTVG